MIITIPMWVISLLKILGLIFIGIIIGILIIGFVINIILKDYIGGKFGW